MFGWISVSLLLSAMITISSLILSCDSYINPGLLFVLDVKDLLIAQH